MELKMIRVPLGYGEPGGDIAKNIGFVNIEKVGHDAESVLGLFERIFCHVEKKSTCKVENIF